MTVTLNLSPDQEAAFKAHSEALGLTIEQWLLRLAEEAGPETGSRAEDRNGGQRPIWEIMLDNANQIPPEEFARLPRDGASEVDHYLYGHPKRKP